MNHNLNLLLDIALVLGTIFYTSRLAYLIHNRNAVLSKHKQGTPAYETASGALSAPRLVIAITVTLLVILKTAVDVRAIIESSGSSAPGQVLFILAFGVLICSMTSVAVYYAIGRNSRDAK